MKVARTPDDADLVTARRDLKFEMLAQHIELVVNAAPPLTPEQRDRLALILRSGSA